MGAYPVLSFGSKRKLPPLIFDLESSPMIDLMCSKSELYQIIKHFIYKNNIYILFQIKLHYHQRPEYF